MLYVGVISSLEVNSIDPNDMKLFIGISARQTQGFVSGTDKERVDLFAKNSNLNLHIAHTTLPNKRTRMESNRKRCGKFRN